LFSLPWQWLACSFSEHSSSPRSSSGDRPPFIKTVKLTNWVSPNLERYERIAPIYDLLDLPFEYSRYRKIRPMLFQGLKGRVLDAGVGTGRNMQFYPPE